MGGGGGGECYEWHTLLFWVKFRMFNVNFLRLKGVANILENESPLTLFRIPSADSDITFISIHTEPGPSM